MLSIWTKSSSLAVFVSSNFLILSSNSIWVFILAVTSINSEVTSSVEIFSFSILPNFFSDVTNVSNLIDGNRIVNSILLDVTFEPVLFDVEMYPPMIFNSLVIACSAVSIDSTWIVNLPDLIIFLKQSLLKN